MSERIVTILFWCLWVGFLGTSIISPKHMAAFYRWFYGRSGVDPRRVAAITPRGIRVGALLLLACMIVIEVWERLHGRRALIPL